MGGMLQDKHNLQSLISKHIYKNIMDSDYGVDGLHSLIWITCLANKKENHHDGSERF